MYSNTRFGELMKGLPRGYFERTVERLGADKHTKGFGSWDQLVAMLYAQLSGCRSLREVEVGFNQHSAHHYHLGTRAIRRSTLADANSRRGSQLFAGLCAQLSRQAHRKLKGELGNLLYLIDSTPIPLKGLGYDSWAPAGRTDRTQGLKVHMLLAAEAAVPVEQVITPPNVNDVEVGRGFPIESGATYVFDKGYCDYNWWYRLQQQAAFFVTRLKRNAGIEIVEQRGVPTGDGAGIIEDAVIRFRHKRPGGQRMNAYHGTLLRRLVVARPDKRTPLILVTNDRERSAAEIAALYKQRWEIELFFKWLKQNLKIKRFLGRSENAVKIQLYTALIAYLLVHLYRKRTGIRDSLKLCLVALGEGLFQRPATEQRVAHRRRRQRQAWDALQPRLAL